MRFVAAVAVALVFASPAAAAKHDPQLLALKKQVAALKAQVADMKKTEALNRQTAICYYALGQDSFRTVFLALSKLSFGVTGANVPAWEQIPRFDDQGACAAVGVRRP